ncbi:MAG TPA: choice-of-anchor Q domain-containing protein [Acidobacteriota bacterium]|nr:choice-of-anchor Q domain-containing protein [Acidobacteriota bacterium]
MRDFFFRIAVGIAVLASSIATADSACNAVTLPTTGTRIVNVSTEPQLQTAMGNLQAGDTIVIANGTYNLTSTLYINGKDNVTIRGNSGCDNVVLVGKGMNNSSFGNVPFGVWSNSTNTTVAHLTIRDTWDNELIFNAGAQSPHVYSVKLLNAGSQFIKSNPTDAANGIGVNNGVVEYSWMEYTSGPPSHPGVEGYTNGISAHAADNWIIRGNVFKNFHTPDTAVYLWNPAVLMWNHSTNTLTERNTFINVDRAVAYGLQNTNPPDHQGGTIRNNFVYLQPGLMSASRKSSSDGSIIVWGSPNTKVYHNTVLANANIFYSIEFRFAITTGGEARNNLADLAIHLRDSATAAMSGNLLTATSGMFVNPASANLHLLSTATSAIDQAPTLAAVGDDFDGETRPQGTAYDIGADEFSSGPPPCLFCDDFNDGFLNPAWTYEKPAWSESGGALTGTPGSKKAIAVASPFSGCLVCSVETRVMFGTGTGDQAWIFGWYFDSNDRMELQIKEAQNKILLKQRSANLIVTKKKATVTLSQNVFYIFRMVFDGTNFTVFMNGNPILTLAPKATVLPGTIGFQVSAAPASFDYIQVQ